LFCIVFYDLLLFVPDLARPVALISLRECVAKPKADPNDAITMWMWLFDVSSGCAQQHPHPYEAV